MSAALKLPVPDDVEPAIMSGKESLLHVLTCGSVDDGKSTLLGRLLFDSHAVLDDQLTTLDADSRRFGTQGQGRDFALLVDGLSAEREQGITIDVAYRYFSTGRRAFIVADTPGHEQYTRNMATGASTAELAIILVDARKGILPQTRRHSYIVSMLGVRHVVLAVNKMDLVGFDPAVYHRIADDYRQAVAGLGFSAVVPVPICARAGDNIASRSARTPWFDGPVLLDYLETVSVTPPEDADQSFRFPVQWVNRPSLDFRGYAGSVASGVMYAHQPVVILPGGQPTRIAQIVTADGPLPRAVAGQAVTVTLGDEIDVSRGDVIVPAGDLLTASDTVTARLLWMVEAPLSAGQNLLIKLGNATANARLVRLHHAVDIHSFATRPATNLAMNEIGVAELAFDKPLVTAAYAANRELGALVLIDRMTNRTVALGVVEAAVVQTRQPVPEPANAEERVRFWQTMANRFLTASALYAIVVALSHDVVLAAIVALAEVALRPILSRLLKSAWKMSVAGNG
jgi:bifunctional enzyme CysN/CysC